MRLFEKKERLGRVREVDAYGSFGGMIIQVSDDDKVAIVGNSAYALQILHPNGNCVRVGWDGSVTVGRGLVEKA